MKRVLTIFLILCSFPLYAADTCQHDGSGSGDGTNYDCTLCLYGEDGICRIVKDLTVAKIQATIDASATGTTGLAADGSAFSGDGVYLPAIVESAEVWTTGLTITGKNIVLAGQGDTTEIDPQSTTANAIKISGSNAAYYKSRITHMKFSGGAGGLSVIYFDGQDVTEIPKGWRIDNLTIDITGSMSNPIEILYGTYGLIDNCYIRRPGKAFRVSTYLNGLDKTYTKKLRGSYEREIETNLGTIDAVYVEDCTLVNTQDSNAAVAFEVDLGGGSVVFRNNTVIHSVLYSKSTRSTYGAAGSNPSYGVKKLEVYNNSFYGECTGGHCTGLPKIYIFGRIGGGTGVIYNNYVVNYSSSEIDLWGYRESPTECATLNWDVETYGCCDGTLAQTWDGNKECVNGSNELVAANGDGSCPDGYTNTGYPCLGQNGRGYGTPANEASEPWYEWGNGSDATCVNGGSCTDTVDFSTNLPIYIRSSSSPHAITGSPYEYVNSTQNISYTPYIYPHPLRGGTKYTLTVTKSGGGTGTVVSDYDGISCGEDCTEDYVGTVVTLTATAEYGSTFIGWSGTGGCTGTSTCQLTMSAAKAATATFSANKMTGIGTGSGSLTVGGTGTMTLGN